MQAEQCTIRYLINSCLAWHFHKLLRKFFTSEAATLALLLVVGVLSSCSKEGKDGSDQEMRSAIESAWKNGNVRLATGDVRFVARGQKSTISKGEDVVSELPLYKAFAEKGYITIDNERDLTKSTSGWNDWFEMTQKGARRTAHVQLTELGRQNVTVTKVGEVETWAPPVADAKIEEIITNDPFEFGVDQYRVIQGTHTYVINDDIAAAYVEARGKDELGPERRFRALLKYDVFEKRWKLETLDIGPRQGDFRTHNVEQAVAIFELSKDANTGER